MGYIPNIIDSSDIPEEFEKYWQIEQIKALDKLIEEEQLVPDKTAQVIEDYIYKEQEPLREEVLSLLKETPSVLQRSKKYKKVLNRIKDFVETFVEGIGG